MAVFLFFGYCLNYMQKIDMSIAIVCMVNHTALEKQVTHNRYLLLNTSMANSSSNYTLLNNDVCVIKTKSSSNMVKLV